MERRVSNARSDLEAMLSDETAKPVALQLSLLEDITGGFSDDQEIGSGGFAVVYKGILDDREVVVKRLSKTHMHEKEFLREVECLMKAKHKNIVRFMGYCADTQGKMAMSDDGKLVMADVRQRLLYMPKGSLDKYITDVSREWGLCYRIIKEICDGVASIVSSDLFERLLPHRNDAACPARGFYTYQAFIAAAASFPGFGTTGSTEERKREVAAFLGQTSHQTTGGWPTAPDGPYSWGYYFKQELNAVADYCVPSTEWPCAPGKNNYNYGPAGRAIGVDLLNNPDLVATDPVVSFKMALWFWMTPQAPKPSCHAVITGQWSPTPSDTAAGRVPGYGVITNIINGGLECGIGPDARVADRIGFYRRYCDLFGISYGTNLDCYTQRPFNHG